MVNYFVRDMESQWKNTPFIKRDVIQEIMGGLIVSI